MEVFCPQLNSIHMILAIVMRLLWGQPHTLHVLYEPIALHR